MLTANFTKQLPNFKLKVNFSIDNGILVLFGPSGAGKTTILQCLAGLVKPDNGLIQVGNRVLFSSEEHVDILARKRNIGYVFQHYALFPHMNIKKNIMYGLKGDKNNKLTVIEVMEMLKITHLHERYPNQISGGEKQRVALARALMTEPDLLLLDEPLSAIEHDTRKRLQGELRKLQANWKVPFVLVTHDEVEANFLGDKIVILGDNISS